MKTVGCVVYQVDLNEIRDLPVGWQVLVYDTLYRRYRICTVGVDKIKQKDGRLVFFLFNAPPLPKVREFDVDDEEERIKFARTTHSLR